MTVATLTLTEFLLARIAEDEATAGPLTKWQLIWPDGQRADTWGSIKRNRGRLDEGTFQEFLSRESALAAQLRSRKPSQLREVPREGSALANAKRVQSECAVKRGIIELHPEAVAPLLRLGAEWAYDEVLRRLATVYADHPDYRQEWRP